MKCFFLGGGDFGASNVHTMVSKLPTQKYDEATLGGGGKRRGLKEFDLKAFFKI